jgi:hypothetical protein
MTGTLAFRDFRHEENPESFTLSVSAYKTACINATSHGYSGVFCMLTDLYAFTRNNWLAEIGSNFRLLHHLFANERRVDPAAP